ncbi:SDR family oxidoreductase [Actinomadura luteofluorescens]
MTVTLASLSAVAEEVRAAGGLAETARVDALDEDAVNGWVDSVVETAGSVDVSVNLISQDALFRPMIEMPAADFGRAMDKIARSFLVTTKAAARHMVKQGSGVILHFGGSDATNRMPGIGTVQIGCDMVEAMRRQWACELGPHSVRVLSMRTGGIPGDALPDPVKQQMVDATLLKRAATLTDVGRVAAFLASDHAASLTSTQVNITAGALVD